MHWALKHRIGYRLRMYSGWILFIYACTHLLNHSMGIFGLDMLEQGRIVFTAFWRLPVFEWLVVTCFVTHFLLVLIKLLNKKTYKGLSGSEWTQIVLGFLTGEFLVHHIFETKIAHKLFDITDSYTYYIYWTPDYYLIIFMLLLTVIWIHGTIGIRSYIKQKMWYPKWRAWLAGLAVALPIFAAWGINTAIREVELHSSDPAWTAQRMSISNPQNVDLYEWSESWNWHFSGFYFLFILLFFLTRKLIVAIRKKRSGVLIRYLDGTSVYVTKGKRNRSVKWLIDLSPPDKPINP